METRSVVDLEACGAHAYARHPSTAPLCMAYRLPGETEPRLWRRGEPCPQEIVAHVARGGRLRAWNALGFEALIWQHVCVERMGWPKLPIEAWVCSMQEARVAGLPGFLDKAASALRISQQKDTRGKKLISICCAGWKDPETGAHRWSDAPADLQALAEYCVQDVRVESAIADAIPRLPEAERRLAILDAKINARGVGVDLPLVSVLTWATEEAKADLDRRMAKVTAGAVPTTTALPKLKAWLAEFGVRDEDESLSKDDLGTLLDGELPPQVRDALLIRQMAAKSSTAKLSAMMAYGATQGGGQRMRGLLSYYGADTGRWAGRGMQPQNLPRASFSAPNNVIGHLRSLHRAGDGPDSAAWQEFEQAHGPMFEVVSKLLRSCVVPGKGNVLDACDLSGIESRVLAWLAGEKWKLDLFRSGGDVYLTAASSIYGRKITKDDKAERLVGKVAELACGYQGAVGAFASMGKNYGVKLPEEEVIAAVRGWRAAHPETVRFWYDLNDAAIDATAEPGREFVVRGRVKFMHTGSHLWCRLPSGRALVYRRATMRERTRERKDGTKWTERYVAYFDGWSWVDLYGGLLCLSGDTLVLSEKGWVPLYALPSGWRVWDGEEWVEHGGVVFKGVRPVIDFNGVTMTPDHEVLTQSGWKEAQHACGEPLAEPGLDRAEVRAADRRDVRGNAQREARLALAVPVRAGDSGACVGSAPRKDEFLRVPAGGDRLGAPEARNVEAPGVRGVAVDVRPLHAAVASGLGELRRAWDYGVRRVAAIVQRLLARHGADVSPRADDRAGEQRGGVFPGELPLGHAARAGEQQARQRPHSDAVGAAHRLGGGEARGHRPFDARLEGEERVAGVFDVLDAGPRRRFVVRGPDGGPAFIVHNCENITQATARGVLVAGMWEAEKRGLRIVLHVHDELVIERPADDATAPDRLLAAMLEGPRSQPWTAGLPLDAECDAGLARYRK